MRPLDCRLFPLDIIEEGEEYYWRVFTTCPDWRKMKELLEPFIPLIERRIDARLGQQLRGQSEVTKEEYPPYKSRQYVPIRKFTRRFT